MGKIIAVDGPAGAGKSTVSKIVASKLGYTYIDTGAMYRAAALKVLNTKKNITEDLIAEEMKNIEILLDESARVFLNGEDVTKKIRTPEVSQAASDVAKLGFVREKLTEMQRKMAERGSVIMDGRDIGTKVLPNADLKIFLTASIDERAKRRFDELKEKNISANLEDVKNDIAARDKQDSTRKIAPLAQAEDAILLDTTNLTIDEVVEKILGLVFTA